MTGGGLGATDLSTIQPGYPVRAWPVDPESHVVETGTTLRKPGRLGVLPGSPLVPASDGRGTMR